ncbi:Na+/H+ antiporter NhaA, partial [Xanthomonas citri pv. citri]
VAGVLLAFTVPVLRRADEAEPGLAEHFEHRWRPVSAAVAVPVFAFFAAGVSVTAGGGLGVGLRDAVTIGIMAGLVLGKPVGILAATWLVQRFTRARLADGLSWWDVSGLGLLAGVGFTVSLLIGELAFGIGSVRDANATVGILFGSLIAALLAAV